MAESYNAIDRCMQAAWKQGIVIPAFNIPYLPMVEPVIAALNDLNTVGMITAARLEWVKFETRSQKTLAEEYRRRKQGNVTFLHQDHVPVIDEDGLMVDWRTDIARALDLGFESVMIDGSRLPLDGNIEAAAEVSRMADSYAVPVEAELGAVMGHEDGPTPDYEELFRSGRGFTDIEEARWFVRETGVNWLSVAVGSVHGAISAAAKGRKKIAARIDLEHLEHLNDALGIPLVLHGGSGISEEYLLNAFKRGIAKLNIATDIRQPYEQMKDASLMKAAEVVYRTTCAIIGKLGIDGSAAMLLPEKTVS